MKRWALMLEFAHKRDLAESVRRLIAEVELRPQPEGRFDGRTSRMAFLGAGMVGAFRPVNARTAGAVRGAGRYPRLARKFTRPRE